MSVKHALYFHINNGGVTFEVADEGDGPLVRVTANHFSHPTASTGVMTTPEGLQALSDFFAKAAQDAYSPPSCVAASKPRDPNEPREMVTVSGPGWAMYLPADEVATGTPPTAPTL